VVINGSNSNWLPIRAGLPQISKLGPLLFIIFINDIVNEMNAEIKLFADDTSLYLIVDNPSDTAFLLNQDLNQIQRWSEKWLVKFNPNTIETMVISSKRNKPYHPLYK
jgi:ABC-type antimicrobial peptide transport system ATPase subunit